MVPVVFVLFGNLVQCVGLGAVCGAWDVRLGRRKYLAAVTLGSLAPGAGACSPGDGALSPGAVTLSRVDGSWSSVD